MYMLKRKLAKEIYNATLSCEITWERKIGSDFQSSYKGAYLLMRYVDIAPELEIDRGITIDPVADPLAFILYGPVRGLSRYLNYELLVKENEAINRILGENDA